MRRSQPRLSAKQRSRTRLSSSRNVISSTQCSLFSMLQVIAYAARKASPVTGEAADVVAMLDRLFAVFGASSNRQANHLQAGPLLALRKVGRHGKSDSNVAPPYVHDPGFALLGDGSQACPENPPPSVLRTDRSRRDTRFSPISLQRQNEVAAAGDDLVGDVPLTACGVDGDHYAGQVQLIQQAAESP